MKPDRVSFIDKELESTFNSLKPEDPTKKGMIKAIRDLWEDIFSGRNVKKELIPKSLEQKYDLNNLWIYDLPNGWRMLYTITNSMDIKILVVVLDWMNHKDYERLFGF